MFKFKFNTRTIAYLALLTALLIVFSFTPIGTIPIGPLSITLNIIPVAIAAIALGPIGGLIIGSVFGLLSFLQCFSIGVPSGMGAILAGISPVLAFIQRFFPRALDGFLVGLIYRYLYKLFKEHDSNLLTTVFGLIVGALLIASGAAVCVNGANKNAVPEAIGHPGTVFIVFGAIAAAIGVAFIALSIINKVSKKVKKDSVSPACFIAGFLSAFLNTAFFMSALILLFGNTEYVKGLMAGRGALTFIVAFVGINAVIEMIVSTVFSGVIGSALYRAKLLPITYKSKNHKKA